MTKCLTLLMNFTNNSMIQNRRPLMGVDNILELQDNGYKSTVSALSELIDNSIQANAKKVDIIIIKNTTKDKDEIDEILVIDNGEGMNENTFNKALQMSSGTRGNAKSGLGKYGQGLPNSSISQTQRVEVYTTQNNKTLYNYIDLNEIKKSGVAYLPDTEVKTSINVPLIKSGKYEFSGIGTIVRWVKPNRVKPKTAKTLASHIEMIAGRIFRYFISGYQDKDGKKFKTSISLLVYEYNGQNYEINDFLSKRKIKAFDPMFLMEKTQMNDKFTECSNPTSILFEEPIKKFFQVEYQGEMVKTEVEIKLSYVKKEERERFGRNAGSTPFGKTYLKRNMLGTIGYNNISIVRSGREIDSGNFGFIGDVSNNRERWWSAEILVEPVIDSIIGIDNKKQNASEIRSIDTELFDDEDVHEIVKWISVWLNENIKEVKSIIDKQGSTSGGISPSEGGVVGLPGGGTSEPGTPPEEEVIDEDQLYEIKREFSEWIIDKFPDTPLSDVPKIVEYALSIRDNHIFVNTDLGDTKLFSYKVYGTKVLIEINISHSFYKRFMQPFENDSSQEKSLRSIKLLIGSMVNAEMISKTDNKEVVRDRRSLRNRMFETLDEYIEDLYNS